MISESCLPPHAQKAVVGKILGLQALVPHLSSLEYDAGELIDRHLRLLTNAALENPDNNETLEGFLENLTVEITAAASRIPGKSQAVITKIVSDIAARVAAFCRSPHDPLGKLFEAVAQTASEFYREYGTEVPAELWRRTFPAFSFLGGKAGLSFASDVHLKIQTIFDKENILSAQVLMQIAPRRLDAHTIAALPRVILHEYIAHVPQGPYLGKRLHPDSSDAFAEGWMDYLAHRVHRAVIEGRGPFHAMGEQLLPEWMERYEDAAESFFAARRALHDVDPSAAARCEGAAAGRQLHDLLRRLPETSHDPDAFLFRLSFGLNASSLDNIERQHIVTTVRRSLLVASEADALVSPLRKWAGGSITLEQLAEALLAVRSPTDV